MEDVFDLDISERDYQKISTERELKKLSQIQNMNYQIENEDTELALQTGFNEGFVQGLDSGQSEGYSLGAAAALEALH